jgi:hypothetical protein
MRSRLLVATMAVMGAVGALAAAAPHGQSAPDAGREGSLVYADFENVADGRPVSSRGGKVSLWGYQESPTRMSVFKGHEADNAIPKLVRTSKTDQNHAAAFG